MSDSVQPQRWQPTRLPHPWDSPGKNTGVGCHFLLQCMKGKSESQVAQSYLTPSDFMDCSLPGSSINGICQARVLEWVAIAFSDIYVTSVKEPACQCRRHKTGRKQFLSLFFFFFWPCWGACKILVILTRVQNRAPCIGAQVLISRLPGKSWQGENAYH